MQPTIKDFRLAKILLNHSLNLKASEHLLITASDSASFSLVKAVYIEALKIGAYPVIDSQFNFAVGRSNINGLAYQYYKLANKWQLNYIPHELLAAAVKWADAYVRIITIDNTRELRQITPEKITLRNKLTRPYLDQMVDSDRWILTYFPTPAMAQEAGVAFDWLMDFYYRACLVDYQKMKNQLLKIERVLDQGKKVTIVGNNTNLSFSIEGRLAKASSGERNIPDGEVFLAPVHQTVNGKIFFEFPSVAYGNEIVDIYLEFKQGQVIKAKAKKGQNILEKILATDQGASRLGELGIGANYQIKMPMNNTLFDEKIGGTIHLALGRSYKEKRGGAPQGANESTVHWDIVKNMRSKGSILSVDNKPLLKEGRFIY